MEITFKSDTSYRKDFFVPESFSHPAKMVAPLLLWIVNKYTQPGETILDPMAGSGTMMLACPLGRNVVMLELEQKFVRMQVDNWEKVRQMPQLGYSMGECTIIQGDARNLEGLFDGVISSPPFASAYRKDTEERMPKMQGKRNSQGGPFKEYEPPDNPDNISNLKYGSIDSVITSPPYAETTHHGDDPAELEYLSPGRRARVAGTAGESPDNIGNLKYGEIDAVVSSPPYEGSIQGKPGIDWTKMEGGKRDQSIEPAQQRRVASLSGYDAVITSPPYEGINTTGKADSYNGKHGSHSQVQIPDYRESTDNIGNLKSTSYLEAMLQVYGQCHKVLRDGGIMILVTKDFIRDQKRIDLAGDTIKLCEEAGFTFLERHYRKLTAVSFWRTIYKQKYPDAPEINTEDILVFRK